MRRLPRFAITAVLGLTGILAACEDPFGTGRATVLPITAIEAPAEVGSTEELLVRVSVQSGGCRTFTGLDATKTAGRLTLTARGRGTTEPGSACTADIRTDVRDYRAEPPHTDPLTIIANQPDGSTTTRTVRVR